MTRDLIAAFAAPAVAIVAIGVGAALASGLRSEVPAYQGMVTELTAGAAQTHARTVFMRADLDRSGTLDADEYASLALVTAELARLNGFLAIETGADAAAQVSLPIAAPSAISSAERVRIDAVARSEFYAAAGADAALTLEEYLTVKADQFDTADRNGNGQLGRAELAAFAAREAMLSRGTS